MITNIFNVMPEPAEIPRAINGVKDVENNGQKIKWMPEGVTPKKVIVNSTGDPENLTEEQLQSLAVYEKVAARLIQNTAPVDIAKVEHLVEWKRWFLGAKGKVPLEHLPSPSAAKKYIKSKTSTPPGSPDTRGSFEAYQAPFLLFNARELNLYNSEQDYVELCALEFSMHHSGLLYLYKEVSVSVDRPCVLKFDINQSTTGPTRLHCEDGPAVRYADGESAYFWRGLEVEKRIIMDPESITKKEIDAQNNAEMRRVLMERFGFDKYLASSKVKPLASDKFGVLYKMSAGTPEEYLLIHVINGSKEPDGSFKSYFLHTRGNFKTPLEAVASTYGVPTNIYEEIVARS